MDDYDDYVPHPRYGRGPRLTGLNPVRKDHYRGGEPMVIIHYRSGPDSRIPNTAIVADIAKQNYTTFPVTHYFDTKRTCRDCRRPFLFFAEEQRYWYEELGFPLDAGCDRCVPCRKRQQGIALTRQRYEELFHVAKPSAEELLEMAECCASIIEAKLFSPRQCEHVRALLHRVPELPRYARRREELLERVRKLERA